MRESIGAAADHNQFDIEEFATRMRTAFLGRFQSTDSSEQRAPSPTPSEVSTASGLSTISSNISEPEENGQRYSDVDISITIEQRPDLPDQQQQQQDQQQPNQQNGEENRQRGSVPINLFVQDAGDNCTICFIVPRRFYVQLRCGHRFCQKCVAQWSRYNSVCPNCRRRFGRHELYTIYSDY